MWINYRSIQGSVTANYVYRTGGQLSAPANGDVSKPLYTGSAGYLYIGYVRLTLYGGDQVQNVNWEAYFDYSWTAQSIVNWWNYDYSSDTNAYYLSYLATLGLVIHNRDSATQTFQYYAEVVRV